MRVTPARVAAWILVGATGIALLVSGVIGIAAKG